MTKIIAGALTALAVLIAGAAANADPVKIRVAWITVPTSLAPILFVKPELAPHLGKTYTLEPQRFAGSSAMTTALAAGDLDIAELSYSSFGYALQNARMDDLRVIADEIQDGLEGYSINYMVLKDSPVKTIEDLKGKVLATNVIGTGTDIGMRAMMRKHGLEDKRDFTIIESNYANMKPLLIGHKADLVTMILAYEDDEVRQVARPLFRLRDVMGVTQILMLAARAPFIETNHAALVDYMEDYLRSLHWYMNPANHTEVVAIVANFNKEPTARYEPWLLTKADQYRDPNARPNLDAMQRNLEMQKEFGFLKTDIDVKSHADLSIVEAAAKRLEAQSGN
jgi:NitT/TauT family transport system substrate-binding protein